MLLPEYDAVLITRNRPAALRASISSLLAQSPSPRRLFVVDSSDPEECARVKTEIERFDSRVVHVPSSAGTSLQRNIGVSLVESPVTLFSDDDSFWRPGAAAAILRVYETDEHGQVGAVCGAEAARSSDGGTAPGDTDVSAHAGASLALALTEVRHRVAHVLCPNPFRTLGRELHSALPAWEATGSRADGIDRTFPVEWMTGFRMTARTEVARAVRFDETLRGYGLFEDADFSFGVLASHRVVGTKAAQVEHRRWPGRRAGGALYGAAQLLNRAYVVSKHATPQSESRRQTTAFCRQKLLMYALSLASDYGRSRYLGARRAFPYVRKFLDSRGPANGPDLESILRAVA